MVIKDKVLSFFVKNFVMSGAQNLNTPGFIFFKMSGQTPIFSRQVVLSENFLIDLETEVIRKLKREGKKLLYVTGKKFGYRFANSGNFLQKNKLNDAKLEDYILLISKFIEGTYASEITCSTDTKSNIVKFSMDNFVVSSKSRLGYFMPIGATAGMMSWIMNSPDIECIQDKWQAKGDQRCELVSGPYESLKSQYNSEDLFSEKNMENVNVTDQYKSLNQVKTTKYNNNSFEHYINSKVFSFSNGVIKSKYARYFLYEVSGLYLLENALIQNGFEKELFDIAKTNGKEIVENLSVVTQTKDMMDLFCAFGYGDLFVLAKNGEIVINIDYYPWTEFYKKIKFVYITGLLSGALSFYLKKDITLKYPKVSLNMGYLSLYFEEA